MDNRTIEQVRENEDELIKQLQQKENIIKEVRECLNKNRVYIAGERNLSFEIEQILDKENK